MICDDVKRVAYFFLDGSMGEKKQTDFKTHVSLCPECEQRVSIHRRLRNFISRRLGRMAAPPTLRQRLTAVSARCAATRRHRIQRVSDAPPDPRFFESEQGNRSRANPRRSSTSRLDHAARDSGGRSRGDHALQARGRPFQGLQPHHRRGRFPRL